MGEGWLGSGRRLISGLPPNGRRESFFDSVVSRSQGFLIGLAFGVVLLACFSATVLAQTSQATIRGSVRDSSNAALVGANLKLVNTETHVVSTSVTNSAGDYLIQNINPGTYTLEASRNGFGTQKVNPFVLVVNQTSTLDFTLPVGNVTETVEVNAAGENIQAATSELGATLESKQIEDLPLNGRNFTGLFIAVPGVSPIMASGSSANGWSFFTGSALVPAVNGQTNRSNLFLVDGILDSETFGNGFAVQPIIDVIQDQKLQSHNDSAEFGGSTGGTINLSTKSGTNTLHGAAYEFNETGSLQAQNYFTPPGSAPPDFTQNMFGGNLGGPIVIPHLFDGHNKAFFFVAYEGTRASGPNIVPVYVPTPAQLAGDFTGFNPIYDPASTVCDANGVCTRTQFPNNIIPANRINQGDLYYAENTLPPISTTPVAGGNAYKISPSKNTFNQFDARGDFNFGQNDSALFRYMDFRGPAHWGWAKNPWTAQNDAYQWEVGYVHVFSATSILHVQGGKTHSTDNNLNHWVGLPADFIQKVGFTPSYITGYITGGTLLTDYQVDNYFSNGESVQNDLEADGWSVKGDYTRVLGKHTLKFGAEFNKIAGGLLFEIPSLEFSQQETSDLGSDISGDALASFLIGAPNNSVYRNFGETMSFGGIFGTYLQDQFQVTPKLTLNLGLRYDHAYIPKYGTPGAHNQDVGNFDFNNGTYIVYKVPGSCAVLQNAPCIPTPDGSLPEHVVASPDGRVLQNPQLNLQPRFGFAYRIFPATAIRGGFGITFDNYAALIQNVRGVSGNWPSIGQIQISGLNAPVTGDPFPGVDPQHLPALTGLPAPTPFGLQNWYIDPKFKDAYSYQWNLGVQHQFNADTVGTISYVGSANRRLCIGGAYNVASTPGPGDPTLRQPYPYMTNTFYSRSIGSGNYNALQAQLNRRFSHGLAATVAYTWGKSIDESCSGFFGDEGCSVQQIYNPKADRSVSAYDIPQTLSFTWIYALPIGRGKALNIKNGVLNMIAGGWQLNGIGLYHSGTPFNLNVPLDIANIGNYGVFGYYYERPNVVGNPYPSHRNWESWINPAAFAVPDQYTYGNEGRNSLRTQFSQNIDASLFKEVILEGTAHLNRGRILDDLHREPEAAAEFAAARRLNPNDFDVYYYWSFVEHAEGNLAKESTLLQRAVKLQPRNDRALIRLASCFLHQSRKSEAVVALRRALAINPKSSDAIYMLSRALFSSDPEESARLREKLETLKAESAALDRSKVLANEGYGAFMEQDWPKAIRLFKEALETCGACEIQATLHKNLGLALCRSGNVDAGGDELRRALALNPNDTDVAKALSVISQ